MRMQADLRSPRFEDSGLKSHSAGAKNSVAKASMLPRQFSTKALSVQASKKKVSNYPQPYRHENLYGAYI